MDAYEFVQQCITKCGVDGKVDIKVLIKCIIVDMPESLGDMPKRRVTEDNGHATSYPLDSFEMQMSFLSLVLVKWTAGIWAKKSMDGHCKTHRLHPDLTPCPTMVVEHFNIFRDYRNDLESVVGEIKEKEKEIQNNIVEQLVLKERFEELRREKEMLETENKKLRKQLKISDYVETRDKENHK
jgi:hypothetical protein